MYLRQTILSGAIKFLAAVVFLVLGNHLLSAA